MEVLATSSPRARYALVIAIFVSSPVAMLAATVQGRVLDSAGGSVEGARVTLFTADLAVFLERRSQPDGSYSFPRVVEGEYRLGASANNLEYVEEGLSISGDLVERDFVLGTEDHPGRWSVIGNTLPEFLDATDIGILRPDGRIFYCHDTEDPILFDPATGQKALPSSSGAAQGCMNGSLLEDGRILFVGGQNPGDPGSFRNAVRWTKTYSSSSDEWRRLPDLQLAAGRWYPGLARLADGAFLVMGGGTRPSAQRTATCELFDLATETWSFTGSMANPTEFPPSALLYTGEVLATWWPPQLYDPKAGTWRETGTFNQPDRGWPGHSDHSLVVLSDGRAIAIGIRAGPDGNDAMAEVYDPAAESWSLTSNPGLLRQQCEVVQLPDGRIFVGAGETESDPAPVPTELGIVKWCDLYDPATDRWRRVADMRWFREYHAVTLLVPDGRILTTGGTLIKFRTGPTSADIEAFEPPYLFRGVRPQIVEISSTEVPRGGRLELEVFPETRLTSVVFLGTGSTTHWVDSGIPRRLVLPVEQEGRRVSVMSPSDANVLPLGYYLLFAMVDDIPSVARIVKVVEARPGSDFHRGDANGDRNLDISDAVFTLRYLFTGGAAPGCLDAVDTNDDGAVDLSDSVRSLVFLFGGAPAPAPPGLETCGEDPTPDGLGCDAYPGCP